MFRKSGCASVTRNCTDDVRSPTTELANCVPEGHSDAARKTSDRPGATVAIGKWLASPSFLPSKSLTGKINIRILPPRDSGKCNVQEPAPAMMGEA